MYRTNLVFDCSCENATPRSLDGLENDDDFSDFKIDGNDELSRLIPLTSLMAYYLNLPACNGTHSAHLCGKGYNDSWKYTAVQKEQDRSTPLPQSFPAEIFKPSPNPYLIYAAEMRETVILQNNLVESNDPMELKNIARLIAKRWKALSHSERKPWDEAHERDRKRYVTENAAIGITIIVTPPEPRMMVDYQTPIDVLTRPNDISASDDPLAPARKKARNTRPNPKPSTRLRAYAAYTDLTGPADSKAEHKIFKAKGTSTHKYTADEINVLRSAAADQEMAGSTSINFDLILMNYGHLFHECRTSKGLMEKLRTMRKQDSNYYADYDLAPVGASALMTLKCNNNNNNLRSDDDDSVPPEDNDPMNVDSSGEVEEEEEEET
eukprot:CAMPEP_0182497748 /NCGR_PEP_ID=MMETSP1321-20130603/6152_1 /TAXON_ID=91990 /ORGANISM="Bolidomonas sp., Strain RCC1657" /LENGTH=379 /DNA_ID=CAMNT_0024701695 /DNA_START=44 /DNA_END=1184 /DNA_ORIENTATION=+